MTPARFLADLRRCDVRLSVNGDRLVVNAPTGAITPDLKEELRLHKAKVVDFLSRPEPEPAPDTVTPSEWAEGIARLQTMSPPANVPPRRWEQFIGDSARFTDLWTGTAAALGWGPADLWGCHQNKPYERIDCAGLLWLLNGAEIVALTADTATIRTRTGAIQSFRRRPAPPGTVLAWELDAR